MNEPTEDTVDDVSKTEAALFTATADHVRFWTRNYNVVPVCWDNPGFLTAKSWAETAIRNTWGANSGLTFTFASSCPTTGTTPVVKFSTLLSSQKPDGSWPNDGAQGQVDSLGMDAAVLPNQSARARMWLASNSQSIVKSRLEYVAVHEMGHILGFGEEHDRLENANNVYCPDSTAKFSGLAQTPYDQNSVMNNCGPLNGVLSDFDKQGVAQLYARAGSQLAGTAGDGNIWHTVRSAAGNYSPLWDVESAVGQELGSISWVSMEHQTNGDAQLLARRSDGALYHTIRRAAGTWTGFGDVRAVAGNIGFVTTTSLADVDGTMFTAATTSDGHLWLAQRAASGSWVPFVDVEVAGAGERGSFSQAGVTGLNHELHFCARTNDGHIWHAIRHANGTWWPFVDIENVVGDVGTVTAVDCSAISGELHLVVATGDFGGLYHTIRKVDTTWYPWGNVTSAASYPGLVANVATSQLEGQLQLAITTIARGLFHTTRSGTTGNWTSFQDVESVAGEHGSFFSVTMD